VEAKAKAKAPPRSKQRGGVPLPRHCHVNIIWMSHCVAVRSPRIAFAAEISCARLFSRRPLDLSQPGIEAPI
jgi:hypothetical protein